MTDRALDELARRVLLDTARQEYSGFMKEPPEHDFSPAFEKKMKKLLHRAKHPGWHQFLQAAACLLLVVLLTGCAVLAVSPELREAFTGWVREVYESYFVYRYNGPEGEVREDTEYLIPNGYRPTWTPDGWQKSEVSEDKATTYVFYENAEGASMVFICTKDPKASTVYLDKGNDVDVQEVQVQDGKADLYMDRREGYSNVIVWKNEETGILLLINGPLTEAELVRMAESVKPVQPETVYRPTWIPEGYTFDAEFPMAGQVVVDYRSQNGMFTLFYIQNPQEDRSVYVNPEGAERFQAEVKGKPAEVYVHDVEADMNIILWSDDSGALFIIYGTLTKDELVRVAESVEAMVWPETLEEYRLAWVPGGYREYEQVTMGRHTSSHTMYKNKEGNLIVLMCVRRAESAGLHIVPTSNEGVDIRSVEVNGVQADLYLERDEKEANVLVWADDDTGMLFAILAHCPGEELVKMAESMEVVPKEYAPTWLPEGFSLENKFDGAAGHIKSFFYENEKGVSVSFTWASAEAVNELYVYPRESWTEKSVSVGGCSANLYVANEEGANSELYWTDPKANCLLNVAAPLPEEDLLKIAESVQYVREIQSPRHPAWIPEGYRLTGEYSGGGGSELEYKDAAGNQILYSYTREIKAGEKWEEIRDAVKGLEPQSVFVNGIPGKLYESASGVNHLVWDGAKPGDVLWIAGPLTSEELIWIAESVGATVGDTSAE